MTRIDPSMTPAATRLARYREAEAFLRNIDDDWARAIEMIGPCRHDPKAARDPASDPGHRTARSPDERRADAWLRGTARPERLAANPALHMASFWKPNC